ncbi:MAG: long-chain-fatty-acid--CoA ligase, partial [Chloroflexi bacterium]|nr:long-chain-fatty-acid--CoA ligase [Chloroflexota bacterium]
VLRLAAALQQLGVEKGTKVGVIEWDSHRYLEMYFGIPGIGAVLHTINPNLAPENVIYTMEHAEDEVLIFHEDFLPLVEQVRPRLPSIHKYILISDQEQKPDIEWVDVEYEELLAGASPLAELPDFDENTQATLSYTTGTTGKPKGVYFTHRQLVLHTFAGWGSLPAISNYGPMGKHEVYMPLTPMFHVHAWGVPYWATVYGFKQVYPGKYDPEMLLRLIVKEGATFSHCVPTILQMVITAAAAKGLDLSHWRVITGGARLTKGLAMAARKLGIKITGGYGLSETCPFLTCANLKPFMEEEWDEDVQLDWMVKTGFVMPLVKIRVIGPDGKDVAADGTETGEIVVRSPWTTPGYYKDPERSEELWAGGWMHTGDVANVDEYGYIQIVDRIKDVIKSGGEWIVSLELENLLSLHDDVLEAAVIGIPDEKWGERPLAIIVPRQGAEERVTVEAMREHLQKFVADGVITSWAVPEHYVFVQELPRTSVGKIDKKTLRSQY